MKIDYPKEWDELPKRERKRKIRELKKQEQKKLELFKRAKNISIVVVLFVVIVGGYRLLTQKSPEDAAFDQEVEQITLEGKVEEFPIEGQEHVSPGASVEYKTNPPTSGGHLAQAENWGVYDEEIDDKAAVHGLEHGGIWITYKQSSDGQDSSEELSDEEKAVLEEIGKENPLSVIVSPRNRNDVKIAVVSWGKMMKLEKVDKALIQKYIDTYKNQSPEKLAR